MVFEPDTNLKIFSGTANEPLARAICKSIGMELGQCTIKPFPDGETFVKIEENVRGEEVFIVQPTSPPTNHNLMELFIMIDALRRASAKRITTVMPFYGYARQDRKDQPRVPITAMDSTSLALLRRLATMARPASRVCEYAWAIFNPPTSGLTTTRSVSFFVRKYSYMTGAAYK